MAMKAAAPNPARNVVRELKTRTGDGFLIEESTGRKRLPRCGVGPIVPAAGEVRRECIVTVANALE
jgi:hypothetical protein